MPLYLKPSKSSGAPVAVCGRCGLKMYHSQLSHDRDKPGLMVCSECNDEKDPYKLPARVSERITIKNPRPDEPLE